MATALTIGVALKWVALHVEVDPLSGSVESDTRFAGCSAVDAAALEWALRLADTLGAEVHVVTAGPPESEALLREALACGAVAATRVALPTDTASEQVGAALASVLADHDVICCGDHSLDRGSGSVPAFVAARLGRAQALGLVRVDAGPPTLPSEPDPATSLTALRRLDYGRREVLRVVGPSVLSFEGGTAELRRAGLGAVLAARDVAISTVPWNLPTGERTRVVHRAPYRPRPRALPPPDPNLPARDRILALTHAQGAESRARTVVADTSEAADLLLGQLEAWGYLA